MSADLHADRPADLHPGTLHAMPTAPTTDPTTDPTAPPDRAELLALLQAWSAQGQLRRLDSAFASFLAERCPAAPPLVLLAAALLAQLEGRGHTCLPLDQLLADPQGLLGWGGQAAAALRAALDRQPAGLGAWLAALRASPLVAQQDLGELTGGVDGAAATAPGDPRSPLVLCGQRLYLRRYWGYERRVAAQVRQRAAADPALPPPDPALARPWLDLLFPAAAADPAAAAADPVAAVDWQKIACGVAWRGRLSVVTGGPGTGKTYTVARLLALLLALDPAPERLRIALAAPTGKAAARLRQAIASALAGLQDQLGDRIALRTLAAHIGPARTLHRLLGARPDSRRMQADAAHPLAVDVLIVDEASMVHLEMMAALLEALPPQARLVLLGDKDQLASVEAGAVLGDLCRDAEQGRYRPASAAWIAAASGQTLPERFLGAGPALAQQTVMLRHSRRFGGPIGQLALAVNAGDSARAAQLLRAAPGQPLAALAAPTPATLLQLALHGRPGADGGYRRYLGTLRQGPAAGAEPVAAHAAWVGAVLADFERFRLLCAVREGDWGTEGLNLAIERALVADGLLQRRGEWYEGRPVMVTRNDPGLGVFNGDIGIVLRAPPVAGGAAAAGGRAAPAVPLRAWFADGGALRSVGVSRLAAVETAFAMTVHKSQGSEFEHTVLVLPQTASPVLTRELVYTGITRARSAFTLVSGRPAALGEALARRTRRASGLLALLAEPGEPAEPVPPVDPADPVPPVAPADPVPEAAA